MRERLTNLDVQKIWLSHTLTGEPINSFGVLNNSFRDDGETVEITFPFNVAINEELNHVIFGEDYEIQIDKPVDCKVDIAIDGTYSVFTEIPIKIIDLDGAIARTKQNNVKVVSKIDDSSRLSIAFCQETNRFLRTPDLRGKAIELFRAKVIYPRWVDYRKEMINTNEGKAEILKSIWQPLKELNLHLFTVEDDVIFYRTYLAQIRRVPIKERQYLAQPKNARLVKLHDLVLTAKNPLAAQ